MEKNQFLEIELMATILVLIASYFSIYFIIPLSTIGNNISPLLEVGLLIGIITGSLLFRLLTVKTFDQVDTVFRIALIIIAVWVCIVLGLAAFTELILKDALSIIIWSMGVVIGFLTSISIAGYLTIFVFGKESDNDNQEKKEEKELID